MLVRAPEPNDKVQEVEIVSAACVRGDGVLPLHRSLSPIYTEETKLKSNPTKATIQQHTGGQESVSCQELGGVNKQMWLVPERWVQKEI